MEHMYLPEGCGTKASSSLAPPTHAVSVEECALKLVFKTRPMRLANTSCDFALPLPASAGKPSDGGTQAPSRGSWLGMDLPAGYTRGAFS